jgi:hypothetical protein
VLIGRPAGSGALAAAPGSAGPVVLDDCCAVRGILNDDQGGPFPPPGLRMALALEEVRASRGRGRTLNKPGLAPGQRARLAGHLDHGRAVVRGPQEQVEEQVEAITAVAETLAARTGSLRQRRARYRYLRGQYVIVHAPAAPGACKESCAVAQDGFFFPTDSRTGD